MEERHEKLNELVLQIGDIILTTTTDMLSKGSCAMTVRMIATRATKPSS